MGSLEHGERGVPLVDDDGRDPSLDTLKAAAQGALIQVQPVFAVPPAVGNFWCQPHGGTVERYAKVGSLPYLFEDALDIWVGAHVPDSLHVPDGPVLEEHTVVRVPLVDVAPRAYVVAHNTLVLPEFPHPVIQRTCLFSIKHIRDDRISIFCECSLPIVHFRRNFMGYFRVHLFEWQYP